MEHFDWYPQILQKLECFSTSRWLIIYWKTWKVVKFRMKLSVRLVFNLRWKFVLLDGIWNKTYHVSTHTITKKAKTYLEKVTVPGLGSGYFYKMCMKNEAWEILGNVRRFQPNINSYQGEKKEIDHWSKKDKLLGFAYFERH